MSKEVAKLRESLASASSPEYTYSGPDLTSLYVDELRVNSIYVKIFNAGPTWPMEFEKCKAFVQSLLLGLKEREKVYGSITDASLDESDAYNESIDMV